MDSRVLLTVDTELAWRHYVRGLSWQENYARSYEAAGVGVPWQLAMLRRHGLKACFFVDPMPAILYGIEPIRRMVEPILAAGQEVQLHLHSVWANIGDGGGAEFELTGYDREGQKRLIRQARELLIDAGAPVPVAFRSGSYAANDDTIDALAQLGIRYDSSHNGSHHPWPSGLTLDPAQIAPVEHRGVIEVPVTQIGNGAGELRHLQLCAASFGELRDALEHAGERRHPVVTIVSHSFEFATRDGLRPNPLLCRRFEQLCAFLSERRERLPTRHFTELSDLPLGAKAAPLPGAPLRKARRMAEQLWSNARYERRVRRG